MRKCLSCRRLDRWPRFAVATALMLFACSPASLKAIPLPGVSWSSVYEFTSGSFSDESGNGNTLSSFTGSPSFVPDRSGSSSSAFQGSTGRILGKTGALAGFNPASNQLSLSAWIKTTSAGNELIVSMGRSSSSFEGEWIWGISNGQLYFWDYQGSNGFPATFTSTTSVNNGQWRHVAFVRNGLVGTFYIDGIPAGSMTAAKNVSYSNIVLALGGDYRDNNGFWTGQMDDLSISSTALTPAQVLLLSADASVPGVETGPTNSISGLTQTSVKLMGGITNLGGTTVTNAGFYLNTNSTATNGVKYSAPGTSFGLGSFSNTITGLTPGTSYYYRAFAANSVGTSYGANEYSFTTPSPSSFTYTNNGTGLTITGYTGTGGVVEIPATIGGVAVTTIGQNAFQSKTSVTSVVIPNGVTTILDAAFAGCSSMTAITLPSTLTSIGGYAFDGCRSLQNITIPAGVTSIGANAFTWCTSLPSIAIPSGLETIVSGTFYNCTSLTSITIPSSVTDIGYNAFSNCSKLATVYFLGNTPPKFGDPTPFGAIAAGAKGYYPATATETAIPAWGSLTQIGGLTIVHPDTQPPVITLTGANPLQIYKGATFSDPGATVTDNVDASRTITGSGTVNTAAVGNYTRTYNTTDAAGNPAVQVTRTVNVVLDPTGDEDGDGVTNGEETRVGTSPVDKPAFPGTSFAVTFNGSSTQRVIEPRPVQDDFTLAFWIKTAQAGTGSTYWWEGRGLLDGEVGGATNDFGTSLMAGGKIGFGVGPADTTVKSTKSVNNGAWHHVVATRKASSGLMNIYVDGVLDSSINGATGTKNAPSRLTLGSLQTNLNYFQGEMADFRIYDREISAADVWLLANRLSVSGSEAVATLLIDTDADGLDNSVETNTGTYVSANNTGTNPNIVDTDGDTLLDGAEVALGTDPTNGDTDGDRVADGVEVNNRTDPLLASSNPLPVIVTQPVGGTKNVGESWSFTVVATDPTSTFLAYQWKKNGVNFREPSFDPTLSFASLQISDAGSYEVLISNPLGNTTSSVVTLVVVDPATITLSTAPGSYTLLQGAVPLDNSLTVTGDETFSGATIQIETGFAAGDTLNLTLSIAGITGIYDGTKGILTLSGSGNASVYQSALRAVTFSTTSASTVARGFKVTLGSAISFGGHYYEYVPGSHSWAGARTLALSKTFNGLSGYLANLTSADENSFVQTKIGTDVWIGGSDEGTEGVWKWMDGPEAGITFWNGLSTGSAPSGRYANWNSGEPNQAGDEDYAQFYVGTGKWNDLPSGSRLGFLVEYGTDTSAIQTFSGTRIFSVTKATPTIIAAPTAAPISYGQTLGSSTLSGGSGSVPGRFAFTTPSTAPSVGTASQSVTFTPTDTVNYNTVTTSVNVTVSRATPTINPGLSASVITFRQTLAESSLSGSASLNGTVVAGTFAFTTPSTAPNAGTASQSVTFTPTDTDNYNTAPTSVSVTVNKATPTIATPPTARPIAYGQTLAFSTLSGGVASVAGSFVWTTPSTLPSAGTVSQSVTFNPTDTANYNTATASVNVTVNQALISSGFSHTLYLGAGASTVTAWGLNTDGRLGVGDMNSPVNWAKTVQGIPVEATVDGLAAGGTHSLILAGGQVYAAGSDRYGQLGQGAVNGANKTSFTSVVIPSSTPVAVSAGGNHSLIVTASGKVFACGDNTYGQLARPATTASSGTLVEVVFPGLSTKIVSAAAGADHNLAVDENGGVWVWGRNDSGQLGKNTRTSAERTPAQIISSGAKSVAAGFAHSLILKQDGTVLGFGRNTFGQTGQSSGTSYAKLPIPISGLSGIRSIAAGTDSSFAIAESGQLYSWGYNSYGELLLGYASPAVYGPTQSPICRNVFNVSGGGYSSLAVGAQGVIFGGRNDVGQAGNGPDPDEVVGDYYYGAGNLALTNLTMDLAGTTETLYDQIFVGNGAVTLNGIVNLMFVGTYTGPVYGTPQTFDLIWAKNGITLDTGYQLAFNQAGYLVESAVADKIVEGVSGKVLQATVRAVESDLDSDKADALALAQASLDGLENDSYRVESNETIGVSQLSASPSRLVNRVEMIYSYTRPTGGVMSGAEYFFDGSTYRVEYTASLDPELVDWNPAVVTGTTITPLGGGYERATLRISSSGGAGFLRLEVAEEENNPQATPSN